MIDGGGGSCLMYILVSVGATRDQTSAANQPTSVHPARRFSARMAAVFLWLLASAIIVGMK